jgi:dTDP-4-amino-4,6-dideoxygalactose transaminase
MSTHNPRIHLSPPHMSGLERGFVDEAFDSNWIAPVGPQIDAFEREFAETVGSPYALALSSGTAGLHLALILAGVGPADEVMVSTLTFSASVNVILYQGARPVFIDSETRSWNMDPELLEGALAERAAQGRLPKAVILVHLYGQSADINPILATCAKYEVALIEDAAEALGATYQGQAPGTLGQSGIFSFNGNKIITTSGGGMLVSEDGDFIGHARKLATQARDEAPHYEHSEIGYNYRMSNVLAAIGRGQLTVLEERVLARRRNCDVYRSALGSLPGLSFMPEAPWGRSSRWLTCIQVNPELFGADPEVIRLALEAENIESRPLWKPMHLQPIFADCEMVGGDVSAGLFAMGLCLPSGSALTEQELARVCGAVTQVHDSAIEGRRG